MSTDSSQEVDQTKVVPACLDQYKAYMQDLGNIGTRYTTSNTFFFTVISALIGIITLFKSSDATHMQLFLQGAVSIFAILLCFTWRRTMQFYHKQFRIKFTVLRELEVVAHIYPIYARELKHFAEPGGNTHGLIHNEETIPLILMAPFVAIVFAVVLKWCGCMA